MLAYAVMTRQLPERTSFFLEQALPAGGGRNVVNVMLVDFRGFDTFGEGVVLALVALTVYALLRRFRPAPEVLALPPQQRALLADAQTDLVSPERAAHAGPGYLLVPRVLGPIVLADLRHRRGVLFPARTQRARGRVRGGAGDGGRDSCFSTSPSGRTGSRTGCGWPRGR